MKEGDCIEPPMLVALHLESASLLLRWKGCSHVVLTKRNIFESPDSEKYLIWCLFCRRVGETPTMPRHPRIFSALEGTSGPFNYIPCSVLYKRKSQSDFVEFA